MYFFQCRRSGLLLLHNSFVAPIEGKGFKWLFFLCKYKRQELWHFPGVGETFIMLVLWSRIRWRMRNAATDMSWPQAGKTYLWPKARYQLGSRNTAWNPIWSCELKLESEAHLIWVDWQSMSGCPCQQINTKNLLAGLGVLAKRNVISICHRQHLLAAGDTHTREGNKASRTCVNNQWGWMWKWMGGGGLLLERLSSELSSGTWLPKAGNGSQDTIDVDKSHPRSAKGALRIRGY